MSNGQSRLERIEEKLDRVLVTQARMELDIKYHIKRTDLLEEQVGLIKTIVAASKVIVWLGAGSAAAIGISKIWQLVYSR